MAANENKFTGLPLSVAEPIDIGRLIREVEGVDETFNQENIRGHEQKEMPKLSVKLKDLIEYNKVDFLNTSDRAQLLKFLEAIRDRAPRVHISFSSEPAGDFIGKIMTWLRTEIHPLLLLTVGLEPGIGAGTIVRTTNKYFNLTLSERLKKNNSLLIEKIKEATGDAPATTATPVPVPVEGVKA